MAVSRRLTPKSCLGFIKGILNSILSFVISAVILIALIVVILFFMRIKPYVVTTGSMEPAIPVSSVCFVNEKIPPSDILPGEVISFRRGEDVLVTHRVVSVNEDSFITKGDANNTEDAPVAFSDYAGKTVAVIPKAGLLLVFLHSRPGLITALAIMALLIIFSFLPQDRSKPDDKEDANKGPAPSSLQEDS